MGKFLGIRAPDVTHVLATTTKRCGRARAARADGSRRFRLRPRRRAAAGRRGEQRGARRLHGRSEADDLACCRHARNADHDHDDRRRVSFLSSGLALDVRPGADRLALGDYDARHRARHDPGQWCGGTAHAAGDRRAGPTVPQRAAEPELHAADPNTVGRALPRAAGSGTASRLAARPIAAARADRCCCRSARPDARRRLRLGRRRECGGVERSRLRTEDAGLPSAGKRSSATAFRIPGGRRRFVR